MPDNRGLGREINVTEPMASDDRIRLSPDDRNCCPDNRVYPLSFGPRYCSMLAIDPPPEDKLMVGHLFQLLWALIDLITTLGAFDPSTSDKII